VGLLNLDLLSQYHCMETRAKHTHTHTNRGVRACVCVCVCVLTRWVVARDGWVGTGLGPTLWLGRKWSRQYRSLVELDLGGGGGVGLVGRPISRWTLSPLAYERHRSNKEHMRNCFSDVKSSHNLQSQRPQTATNGQ